MKRRSYSSLRAFLKQTRTSQQTFGQRVGISQSFVCKISKRREQPTLDLALRIAEAANIPVESLVVIPEEKAS